jgi:hypothetical protein
MWFGNLEMVNAPTFGWTNKVQIMLSFSFISKTYVDTALFVTDVLNLYGEWDLRDLRDLSFLMDNLPTNIVN